MRCRPARPDPDARWKHPQATWLTAPPPHSCTTRSRGASASKNNAAAMTAAAMGYQRLTVSGMQHYSVLVALAFIRIALALVRVALAHVGIAFALVVRATVIQENTVVVLAGITRATLGCTAMHPAPARDGTRGSGDRSSPSWVRPRISDSSNCGVERWNKGLGIHDLPVGLECVIRNRKAIIAGDAFRRPDRCRLSAPAQIPDRCASDAALASQLLPSKGSTSMDVQVPSSRQRALTSTPSGLERGM